MARQLISSGSSFERDAAFSRVVADGDWAFVSGTTGFDYATMTISDDVAEQTGQAVQNISSALAQAGFSLADVVQTVYILPRAEDYPLCWPVLREFFAEIWPANTMLVARLPDPRIRIEIEVTAHRTGSSDRPSEVGDS